MMKKIVWKFGVAALAILGWCVPAVADGVTVTSSAGAITVTVSAGTVASSAPVYLVWDTENKGDILSAWAHRAKIGEVTAVGGVFNVTGATHSIPDGAVIRVFVVDGTYDVCEYLQGDGNAYLELDYTLSSADEVTIVAMPNSVDQSGVFGARDSANSQNFTMARTMSSKVVIDVNDSAYNTYRLDTGWKVDAKVTFVASVARRTANGTGKTNLCPDTFTTAYPCRLFSYAGSMPGSYAAAFNGRVYSFKISTLATSAVQRDLVAVNLGTDANPIPGMYDKETGATYENESTVAGAAFTLGPKTGESVGEEKTLAFSSEATYEAGEEPEPPEPPTGGVAVESANGAITVTVDADAVASSSPVYLVWDTEDQGDAFADWTHSAKIGDVTAEGGVFNVKGATHSIPNGAAIRVFVRDGVALYSAIVKPRTVNAAIVTGYVPGVTRGTAGWDLDAKFDTSYVQVTDGNNFMGVYERFAPGGSNYERFSANFGVSAADNKNLYSWPHAVNHPNGTTATARYIVDENASGTQLRATRNVISARLGEYLKWGDKNTSSSTYLQKWPDQITHDFNAPVAIFGVSDWTSATESSLMYMQIYSMTLYGARFYDKVNDELTVAANYVPAEKNGEKGLYDTMNGVFYPASAEGFTFEGAATNVLANVSVPSAAATYEAGEEPPTPIDPVVCPVIDLTGDTVRDSVVAEGTATVYQGHPTTVTTEDGRIIVVWCTPHGGHCGPAAESSDGGRTWTRIDDRFPAGYSRHVNCPSIYRLVGPDGKSRLWVWSEAKMRDFDGATDYQSCRFDATRSMPSVMSEDDGLTWQEVAPLGEKFLCTMAFTSIVRLKDGSYLGVFHTGASCGMENPRRVWQSITTDGGFTWSDPELICYAANREACEPYVFRSPDGNELCCLMRDENHNGRSMMIFSQNEGQSWTSPVDTPWGLTGDRHQGVTLPDGRLVIAFRDRALGSTTAGDFVAWVGTYEELKTCTVGESYRLRLLRSYDGVDCGYPGIELVSAEEEMITATTYIKYWNDSRKQSVVAKRFSIAEVEGRLDRMMTATVTGATGPANGTAYSCALDVTDPAGGYTALWYNGSDYTLAAAPTHTEEGVYEDSVKVTKTGYSDFYGTGVVTVVAVKPVTVSWGETSLAYSGAAQVPVATLEGVAAGDDVTPIISGAETTVGTGYTAKVTGLGGADAWKYVLSGTLTTTFEIKSAAAGIYVATTGHDDTGDGTPGNPYATIATGIAAAKAAITGGEASATVYVADSVTAYAAPNATLDAAIAVIGNLEHPENVVIDDATAGERAFTLSHADAKVAGVTITGAGYKTAGGSGGHISMSAGTVEDCIIEGGRASANNGAGKGGNVSMSGGCLRRCIVRNGKAADSTSNGNCRGANIYATGGVVENCLVTGGSAQTQSQSSLDVDGATVRVVNCTIVGNSYTGTATASIFSGLHVLNDKARVINCVIYGNGGTAAKEWGNARAACFINCAVASGAAITGGTGNIDTVTEDAFKDYANGDYRPEMGVLVDSGVSENDYVNTYGATSMTDLAGGERVIRDNLDIGAYEFQQGGFLAGGGASIYSAGTETPVTFTAMSVGAEGEVSYLWDFGDGTTSGWTTEATVTHAYALAGDYVVSVKAKTEEQGETAAFILPHGAIHTVPADICVDSENGNDETGDGTSEKPLATLAAAYALAKNSRGELSQDVTVRLADGTYAAANMTLDVPFAVVGNVDDPSQVVINDATAGERAFTLSHADAKVAGVTITGAGYKTAGGSGGHIDMSAGTVEDCIIEGGRASANNGAGKGGNVSMSGGCLRRCIVRNGKAADSTGNGTCRGANIYATGGVVENCLVTGGSVQTQNQSSLDVDGATVRVVNCTIVGNSHTSTATVNVFSGIHVFNDNAQVVNCVIYGNGGTAAKEWGNARAACFINCAVASDAAITGGTGNIDTVTDAAFKNYANGDYTPKAGGAFVDRGDTEGYATYGATSATDLAGNERIVNDHIDIGAYELQPAEPTEPTVVTVTPNANQAKTVGDDDPTLTYTLSEDIVVTGALAREAGEEVGTYAIDLGTLGAADPTAYTLELAATPVYFSITNAVTPPTPPDPPTGGVAVSSSEGQITVTIAAGTVAESSPVYLVWDTEDQGDAFADWTNSAKIGDVTAAGGVFNVKGATHSIPNGAAIRVFVRDGVALYSAIVKPRTVKAAIVTGYVPGVTRGTAGWDLDAKFDTSYVQVTDGNNFMGVYERFAPGGSNFERFSANFGTNATDGKNVYAWPHAVNHPSAAATARYIVDENASGTQLRATRNVISARLGEFLKWGDKNTSSSTYLQKWPTQITHDYNAPVAIFGVSDWTSATASSLMYMQIYSMTLYGARFYDKVNDELTVAADYVPAEKNGEKGLYDTMNGVFYPASAEGFTFEGAATNTIYTDSSASDAATYSEGGEEPPTPGIQVGDNLTATFENGVCTISGTGAMWEAANLKAMLDELGKLAITDLVIGEGVTSIGDQAFRYGQSIRNVTIGSTVANIGQQAFDKCYALSNVVIQTGATPTTVGAGAFARCFGLTRITVTGDSSVNWANDAFTLQAGIRINSDTGLPEIYPIPEIVDANGSVTVLYGTNDLGGDWTRITSSADRANYHFFKIKFEKK